MRRSLRSLFVALAMVGASGAPLSACNDDVAGTGGGSDISGVVYQGGATDEALEALLAGSLKQDATQQAVFDWPSDGEILAFEPVTSFCWHAGPQPTGRREWSMPPFGLGQAPASGEKLPVNGPGDRALRGALELLLAGVPEAHAHGTPVNGPGYFLVLSTEDDPKLLRVFTTQTVFTPDETLWARLTKAGKPVTAKVLWADFETNRIAPDGGPWDGLPITVTIRSQ